MSGERLTNASATVDPQSGKYVVALNLIEKNKKFGKITTENKF